MFNASFISGYSWVGTRMLGFQINNMATLLDAAQLLLKDQIKNTLVDTLKAHQMLRWHSLYCLCVYACVEESSRFTLLQERSRKLLFVDVFC